MTGTYFGNLSDVVAQANRSFGGFGLFEVFNISNNSNFDDLYKTYLKTLRSSARVDVWEYLEPRLGPRRGPLETVIVVTIIYCVLFLTGIFGNVCTCMVIAKNKYMHTATNYYLFNLAVADLLLLIVGLPPETYLIWAAYPWMFGEAFCIIRTMIAEMSTCASILTITAFTIERYVAICHPMKAQTMSSLKRVCRVIGVIWVLAIVFAIPQTVQYKLLSVPHPKEGWPIPESTTCGIEENRDMERMFEISTFVFFVFPMSFISVMYALIALAIRRSALSRAGSDSSNKVRLTGGEIRAQQQARARRSVLKMLVAVVVAFFCCWAPFHTQRLMTLYIPPTDWTPNIHAIHKIIYYISGVSYFLSCTINPILYSMMSLKFRQAFKQTVLKPSCCKRPPRPRKRSYFSYKFAHRNGYSETSFTSVEGGSPPQSAGGSQSTSHSDQCPHCAPDTSHREGNASHTVNGSFVKVAEDKDKKDGHYLHRNKSYDRNCNRANLYSSMCDRKQYGHNNVRP